MASLTGITPSMSTAASAGASSAIAMATASIGNNKYLLGLMILLINLGARYIGSELTEFQHKVLNHKFARRFLIFLVIWMGTRDLLAAIVITVGFIFLVNGLFNENSKFCILPSKNDDVKVTPEEYQLAKQIIEKYEKENVANVPPHISKIAGVTNNALPINNNNIPSK